jgi:hypothetical protein
MAQRSRGTSLSMLAASAGLLLLLPNSLWGQSRWAVIGEFSNVTVSLDTLRPLESLGPKQWQGWTQWTWRKRSGSSTASKVAQTIEQMGLDCATHRLRTRETIEYDSAGSVLKTYPATGYEEWTPIVPSSIGEAVLLNFCASRRWTDSTYTAEVARQQEVTIRNAYLRDSLCAANPFGRVRQLCSITKQLVPPRKLSKKGEEAFIDRYLRADQALDSLVHLEAVPSIIHCKPPAAMRFDSFYRMYCSVSLY